MNSGKSHKKSALRVNAGVEKPEVVNPLLRQTPDKFRKNHASPREYFRGIQTGDRTLLSRAITLIESTLSEDRETASELIRLCLPFSGEALRLGVTGVPGVGKSTFIESFGLYLIKKGHRVAVLTIDPSSMRSRGSILGDKTRMEELGNNNRAFIRPSASAGTLGGVARKTREAMILCETAGFDTVFVETVGVGQSETAVAQMVDFFLLLMLAGGGDELQGIKRGIMEMADLVVINKADGENKNRASLAKREYENALHLFPPLPNGWQPSVMTASALYGENLSLVWQQIEKFLHLTKENGSFVKNRKNQDYNLFEETIHQAIHDHFFRHPEIKKRLTKYKTQILNRQLSPYEASQKLLDFYFSSFSK
ncbi:MAG: ATPase/protein kinase [bacterium]|nr:MAG: ATPase/protein kinase [bacterium]